MRKNSCILPARSRDTYTARASLQVRRGSSPSFAKVKDVKLGDAVTYTTAYGTLTYVVSNITTVATTDTSGL